MSETGQFCYRKCGTGYPDRGSMGWNSVKYPRLKGVHFLRKANINAGFLYSHISECSGALRGISQGDF